MAMTWRPPDDFAKDMRWAVYSLQRPANKILNDAFRDWYDAQIAAGRLVPRQEGKPDVALPVR